MSSLRNTASTSEPQSSQEWPGVARSSQEQQSTVLRVLKTSEIFRIKPTKGLWSLLSLGFPGSLPFFGIVRQLRRTHGAVLHCRKGLLNAAHFDSKPCSPQIQVQPCVDVGRSTECRKQLLRNDLKNALCFKDAL